MPFSDFACEMTFNGSSYKAANLYELEKEGMGEINRLPFAARIILENLIRNLDTGYAENSDVAACAAYYSGESDSTAPLIPFSPSRILMQDFTGVPAIVDLAAMRDAAVFSGADPAVINPVVPVDLVVDHSVQVDAFRQKDAEAVNRKKEYERNEERYRLLKWARNSFDNLRVVPPGSGICHQVNLECFAGVVTVTYREDKLIVHPETIIGTDSHTTMINSLGILGWGVGGIEAEAVMLGQPYYMNLPEIVGVRLTGRPSRDIQAMDIVLTLTEMLRKAGVVEKIVEFTGSGLKNLSLADRATISNMAPEYGATSGFFPVDFRTIDYLCRTNRVQAGGFVEFYCKERGFFATGDEDIRYAEEIRIDLSKVERCIAGPSRPQDRISLDNVTARSVGKMKKGDVQNRETLTHGNIVIAAITSCTNTSNPHLMMAAGLAARNAVKEGLNVPWFVKTSLSPGSKVVIDYLAAAGLLESLERLGFCNTGYGCMTCIGNSGPLDKTIENMITADDLHVVSVLSGNRNFEARIHQLVKSNYLMSPVLVVLFALAGRIDIDFEKEPLGVGKNNEPVFFHDIWPDAEEIDNYVATYLKNDFFENQYAKIFQGDDLWHSLKTHGSLTFDWDKGSLYIRRPPFFEDFSRKENTTGDITGARALLMLGDSVTTDHVSPAGEIPENYPAGSYLRSNRVKKANFNTYGARRGNHEVMMRGTFANIRIRNRLVEDSGGHTLLLPEKEKTFVFAAAREYEQRGVPLVVLAGREYGTGSSRDWAAKGTALLGVKAVIASSFERIHRTNLVGMGVLPLEFMEEQNIMTLSLDGNEIFEITGVADLKPGGILTVKATKESGETVEFEVISRLDTQMEIMYYKEGGILQYVLKRFLKGVR